MPAGVLGTGTWCPVPVSLGIQVLPQEVCWGTEVGTRSRGPAPRSSGVLARRWLQESCRGGALPTASHWGSLAALASALEGPADAFPCGSRHLALQALALPHLVASVTTCHWVS